MTRPNASRQLARQWRVLQAIALAPHTVADLAALTGVSKASAQRDVDVLAQVFPVTRSGSDTHKQLALYAVSLGCPACAHHAEQARQQAAANLGLIKEHEKRVATATDVVKDLDLRLRNALCGVTQ